MSVLETLPSLSIDLMPASTSFGPAPSPRSPSDHEMPSLLSSILDVDFARTGAVLNQSSYESEAEAEAASTSPAASPVSASATHKHPRSPPVADGPIHSRCSSAGELSVVADSNAGDDQVHAPSSSTSSPLLSKRKLRARSSSEGQSSISSSLCSNCGRCPLAPSAAVIPLPSQTSPSRVPSLLPSSESLAADASDSLFNVDRGCKPTTSCKRQKLSSSSHPRASSESNSLSLPLPLSLPSSPSLIISDNPMQSLFSDKEDCSDAEQKYLSPRTPLRNSLRQQSDSALLMTPPVKAQQQLAPPKIKSVVRLSTRESMRREVLAHEASKGKRKAVLCTIELSAAEANKALRESKRIAEMITNFQTYVSQHPLGSR